MCLRGQTLQALTRLEVRGERGGSGADLIHIGSQCRSLLRLHIRFCKLSWTALQQMVTLLAATLTELDMRYSQHESPVPPAAMQALSTEYAPGQNGLIERVGRAGMRCRAQQGRANA